MTKANAIPIVPRIKITEECGICVSTLSIQLSLKKMKTSNMKVINQL